MRAQRGSAMLMAVFVLVLLSSMGLVLLSASRTEVRSSQADLRSKNAFYLAEAGLDSGRDQLRVNNLASATPASLNDELTTAAGTNGTINFDAGNLRAVYDSAGRVTSLTGYGDDVPVVGLTTLAGGWYAAFVTNDAVDGKTSLSDTNDRVLVTAVGAGSDRSLEIVQAIVQRGLLPGLPATITLLGNSPSFDSGSSNAKTYEGDDCTGATGYTATPGLSVPVVGAIGATSVSTVQGGISKPGTFHTSMATPTTGTGTVKDVSTTINPLWLDCQYLLDLADSVRSAADYVCTSASPCSHWGSSTINTITFVDGDLSGSSGKGVLFVTGDVSFGGNTSWEGAIYVIGTGVFDRNGGGNGHTWGGTIIANIAGADGLLGTGDDCSAAGGGFGPVTYHVNGGGNHDTTYCADAISQSQNGAPLKVASFRER